MGVACFEGKGVIFYMELWIFFFFKKNNPCKMKKFSEKREFEIPKALSGYASA